MKKSFWTYLALVPFVLALSACGDSSTSESPETLVHTRPAFGIAWNMDVDYGLMKDSRDGQVYRTVQIGTQTWMAENLSYRVPGTDSGSCVASRPDSCAKSGRHYSWAIAMGGATSSATVPSGVGGVCPTGWHLPSIREWDTLVAFVERDPDVGVAKGGTVLKNLDWESTSTDLFGFRALPAGYVYADGMYMHVGVGGGWWSSTEASASLAMRRDLGSYSEVYLGSYDKSAKFTVRCLRD